MIELDTSKVRFQADFNKRFKIDFESFWFHLYICANFDRFFWVRFLDIGANLGLDKWSQTVYHPVNPTDQYPPPWRRMKVHTYGIRAAIDLLGFRIYADLKPFMKKEIIE